MIAPRFTLFAVLALLLLNACRPDTFSNATPIRSTAAIQPFFTTPALVYPDNPQQRPASPLLDAVVADMDAARQRIDVAAFDLDLHEITATLLRAVRRGVAVRFVVDSENLDTPEVAHAAGQLERAGVTVTFDRREPFMHHKFIVLDGTITWTGSWNITENDTYRNNNTFVRLVSHEISAAYTREFDQLADGLFGTGKTSHETTQTRIEGVPVEVHFSPQDGVAQHILERINAAQQSVMFLAFSYTSEETAQAMIARVRAGVIVRGVFERRNAKGLGSKISVLRSGGADVLEDGNCYVMHHKTIVIDERIVITGSYNFTNSAEHSNDENLVIIEDPRLAQTYLAEVARVYAQAQTPARCR